MSTSKAPRIMLHERKSLPEVKYTEGSRFRKWIYTKERQVTERLERADLTSGDLSLRLVELPPVLTTRDWSQADGSQTSLYNLPVLRIRIRDPD